MRKRCNATIAATFAAGLLIAGEAAAQRAGPGTPAEGPAAPALDPMLERMFAVGAAPGMTVIVVRDTQVVYRRGFGWADVEARRPFTPATAFYIASTTKTFTGLTAALLERAGRFRLQAPLSSGLPGVRLQPPLDPDAITLQDLLTHTHGITNGGPVVYRTAYSGQHTDALLVELLFRHGPEATGRAFRYGNIGYNIMSLVINGLGEHWKDVERRLIFEPLGMTSTTARLSEADASRLAMPYRPTPDGHERVRYTKGDGNMHAAGGIVTSAEDLARWLEVHINDGVLDGRRVFPADLVQRVRAPLATQDGELGGIRRHGYALGWNVGTLDGDTILDHGGGFPGFRTSLSFMPGRRIGVAVLVNDGFTGGPLADAVTHYVYDRLIRGASVDATWETRIATFPDQLRQARAGIAADRSRRAARPQTLPHPLAAYTGVFENDELGTMEWRVVEGRLFVTAGLMASEVEVYDGAQNQLRVELTGGGEVVAFVMEGGQASGLRYAGRAFTRTSRDRAPM